MGGNPDRTIQEKLLKLQEKVLQESGEIPPDSLCPCLHQFQTTFELGICCELCHRILRPRNPGPCGDCLYFAAGKQAPMGRCARFDTTRLRTQYVYYRAGEAPCFEEQG